MRMANADAKLVIGYVGLGAIGAPMARRIAQAGHPLVVCDQRAEAMAAFQGLATPAATPRDVADQADVVFSCLPTLTSHHEAITGPQGVIRGQRARAYVHSGTTGRVLAMELEAALRERGIAMLDAPITGGVAGARDGTLTVMTSGDAALAREVEPVIQSFARKVVYLGDGVGKAQTMKLVNNMLVGANLVIPIEALVLGHKAGLPVATMMEIINSGPAQNHATLGKILKSVLPRTFNHGGVMHLIVKDLNAYVQEAEALGVDCGLGAAVLAAYQHALDTGNAPTDDMTAVIQSMERDAQVTLPPTSF